MDCGWLVLQLNQLYAEVIAEDQILNHSSYLHSWINQHIQTEPGNQYHFFLKNVQSGKIQTHKDDALYIFDTKHQYFPYV
jgi:hypothetical protein